jgi:hypothetical protein
MFLKITEVVNIFLNYRISKHFFKITELVNIFLKITEVVNI